MAEPDTEQSEPLDTATMAHGVATAIAQMREVLAPIDEAVAGYRAQLEKEGWSPTVAEDMALSMHRALMASFTVGGH